MAKRYVGDGVYVAVEPGRITVTTENGLRVLQEIILEWPVFDALLEFVNEEISVIRQAEIARSTEKGLFDDDE